MAADVTIVCGDVLDVAPPKMKRGIRWQLGATF